jgi:DNA/RNA endonuclease YhcR with UshA esterase domain
VATDPASAPAPGATAGSTSDAAATSQSAVPAATNTATPQTPVPPGVITIVAAINKIADNGDLVVNDGNGDFTVVMSPSPKVVNLDGKAVGKELIQVGLSVQITGLLTGTSVSPQTIVIPVK